VQVRAGSELIRDKEKLAVDVPLPVHTPACAGAVPTKERVPEASSKTAADLSCFTMVGSSADSVKHNVPGFGY
jgi:hypothetical protein